jgi:moderate conductance mechanosensitive channel
VPLTASAAFALVLRFESLRGWADDHGSRVVIVVLIALLIHFVVKRLLPPAMQRTLTLTSFEGDAVELHKRADTLSHVLVRLVDVIVIVMTLFFLLGEIGYNLAPIVTGLGIGGIAIGLGAQSLVKDTINGLFILGENQYRRGDYVTVATVSGTVMDVNLRRTVLRDIDGTVHSIPNSSIQVSSNHTRDYSGINVSVLVPHTASLDRAIALATEVGEQLKQDPAYAADLIDAPVAARIDTVDERGVSLRILGKTRAGAGAAITFEYRKRLNEAYDGAGLGFAVVVPAAKT